MADNLRESGFQILHCSEDDLVPEENADQLHEVTIGNKKKCACPLPCVDFLFKSSVNGISGNNDTQRKKSNLLCIQVSSEMEVAG